MDVYQFRQSLGMNQKDFADFIGIRQATVSEWETGTKKPSPMACKLMTLLKEKRDADSVAAADVAVKRKPRKRKEVGDV